MVGFPFWGRYSAATAAWPNSIAASQMSLQETNLGVSNVGQSAQQWFRLERT
jgi:hypothetical protein